MQRGHIRGQLCGKNCELLGQPGSDPARQFNMEIRAADACASPHLSLAVLLRAGLEGVRAGLEQPPLTNYDPADMDDAERERLGIRRLPSSLGEALDALQEDQTVMAWFSKDFIDCYFAMKRHEIGIVAEATPEELC